MGEIGIIILNPVIKHSKCLGFLKAPLESEMQFLFQNCILDKLAFLHKAKFLLCSKILN